MTTLHDPEDKDMKDTGGIPIREYREGLDATKEILTHEPMHTLVFGQTAQEELQSIRKEWNEFAARPAPKATGKGLVVATVLAVALAVSALLAGCDETALDTPDATPDTQPVAQADAGTACKVWGCSRPTATTPGCALVCIDPPDPRFFTDAGTVTP